MASKRPLASKAQAKRQVNKIRAYHAEGKFSLALSSKVSKALHADALGWSGETQRKARQFATLYSEDQLDELCALILKCRPLFGTAHVDILLAIPWPRREKFQYRCIKRNWSRRQLKAAKTRRFKRKSRGGRYPQVSLADAVVELELHSNAFCRLVDFLSQPQHGEASILDGMSARLRAWVELAHDPMKGVRKAACADLKKTQEG
jgi:hypothetical protein